MAGLEYSMPGVTEAQRMIDAQTYDLRNMPESLVNAILIAVEQNTAPYVPVDTSTLINSATIKVIPAGASATGELAYTADYAVYVHEGGPKNWQKPGARDEFLVWGVADFIADDLNSILAAYGFE